MTVIANTTLLIRRIAEVRRRREAIVDRQDRLRGSLPQWALAPLQLVGLTAAEKWNGQLPTTMVPGSAVPFIGVK
mgnify:CR=1 FL=1